MIGKYSRRDAIASRLTMSAALTAKLFVELGLAQAIVPAVHACNFEKRGSVKAVPIADLPPVSIGWAFRHWHHLSPAAREFVAITNQEISKLHNVPGLELAAAIR